MSERTVHGAIGAATIACALLVPIELGWVPFLRHAWGLTLWLYLPPAAVLALAAGVLALLVPQSRARLVGLVGRVPMDTRLGWALLVALPFLVWPLRSRFAYGDSRII